MIHMYQYITFLISQYSDILHDTEQCVLISFDRWTYITFFCSLKLFSCKADNCNVQQNNEYCIYVCSIESIDTNMLIYQDIRYIDVTLICIDTVSLS